jgi:uncharacterized protein
MAKLLVSLIVVALVAVGCYNSDEPQTAGPDLSSDAPDDVPTFPPAKVLIDTGDDSVLVDAEVAEKPEQTAFGLMYRETLKEDAGMVFLFFEPQTGGFYMKNTLIPLSIAYFDAEGYIVSILDMEPCDADPCPTYDPDSPYFGALEVNQGAFEEWDVDVGDRITVSR